MQISETSQLAIWDLDEVKELDWGEITHNLSKKITKERGKYIEGMFFSIKEKPYIYQAKILLIEITRLLMMSNNHKAPP